MGYLRSGLILPCWAILLVTAESYQIVSKTRAGTHETIMSEAIELLASAGETEAYQFFKPFEPVLTFAQTVADTTGGNFKVLGKDVPRASFSHFFNPKTNEGLVVGKKFATGLVTMAAGIAMGPGIPSTEMCNWNYAEAIQHMRAGDTRAAFSHLGVAIHYVQDATVPQHTTDCGADRPKCRHTEYEDFVDEFVIREVPHPKSVIFVPSFIPSDYVKAAASQSYLLINITSLDTAKPDNASRVRQTAISQIQHAIQLSAGLLKRFFQVWRTDPFQCVVLRVDELNERKGRKCKSKGDCERERGRDIEASGNGVKDRVATDADMTVEVTIGLKGDSRPPVKRRGYFVNKQHIGGEDLEKYDKNGWIFTEPFLLPNGTAEVTVNVFDVYADLCKGDKCGKKGAQIDVSPEPGIQGLKILVDLAAPSMRQVRSSGCDADGNCIKAADITVTVGTKFPMPPRVVKP